MTILRHQQARFDVGDWVSFSFGARQIIARIVEDRGSIGVQGRRLYRLTVRGEGEQDNALELPEQQLAPVLKRAQVIGYLADGALVRILKQNAGGGKNPPRAWITRMPTGAPTHTFTQGNGLIGGAAVPPLALHDNHIFTPRTADVIRFLLSFGLTTNEAEQIVATVGTRP